MLGTARWGPKFCAPIAVEWTIVTPLARPLLDARALGDNGRVRKALGWAAIGAALALLPALALFGFTVDDALIPARYAAHLARGLGYRFNAGGPSTDGVTPLGWAFLLAPFAGRGALAALAAAKVIGLVAWTAAAGAIGAAIHRASERPVRYAALALIAFSAPLAAWSVAGLETGLCTAIAAGAVAARGFGRGRLGAASAGIAAALRPELLPWALVVSVAPGPRNPGAEVSEPTGLSDPRTWWRGAIAGLPFVLVAMLRFGIFGRFAPLSVMAKPPDAALGAKYAIACFLLTGPVALVAPIAWSRLEGWPRGLVLATLTHFVAIALAGGDWMPLSRLVVPVLPGAALAAAYVASVVDARVALLRIAVALAGEIFALVKVGPEAARVGADRRQLIQELSGVLSGAHVVASVDAGWVGAATEATIVDLAGVTDPAIAALPGSHTSKRLPPALFDTRQVDTLVLLLRDHESVRTPWAESSFSREVEWRAAMMAREDFELVAESHGRLHYLVLRRAGSRLGGCRGGEAPMTVRLSDLEGRLGP